ncbi:mCG147114 [Mus musculus]|nr:mCG147114 [Mus musculus]
MEEQADTSVRLLWNGSNKKQTRRMVRSLRGQRNCHIFRRPEFSSQYPQCGSSVTPVPRDVTASSDLQGHQSHMWCAYIYADPPGLNDN